MKRLNLIVLGFFLAAAVFLMGSSLEDNDEMLRSMKIYEDLYEIKPDQAPIEYMKSGPVKVSKVYSTQDFYEDQGDIRLSSRNLDKVLIIVGDSVLYDSISDSLVLYKTDLENECYNVEIYTWEGGTRDSLRTFLRYNKANLVGAILVGDLPIPWFNYYQEGEDKKAPMDLGYADLDADWYDRDTIDGWDYVNRARGDLYPEIWIGRLYAANLDSAGDRAGLLNDYFSRNHQYRTGKIKPSHSALCYIDNGIGTNPPSSQYVDKMTAVFDDLASIYGVSDATKGGYLDSLDEDYEFVNLKCHSGVMAHGFYDPDESNIDNAMYYDIADAECLGIYYFLYACQVNNWAYANNIGRYYIFGETNGLLNSAFTVIGGLVENKLMVFMDSLLVGYNCGDALKQVICQDNIIGFCTDSSTRYWRDGFIGFHCFIGDPTLSPVRRTWVVDSAGNGDAPTIQAAIDSAQCGDSIMLVEGTYTGGGNYNIDFKGKALTVTAESDEARVVIDCQDNFRAFRFHYGESLQARLIGVEIINGRSGDDGGAILIDSGSCPKIVNCLVRDSRATNNGGAIAILDSSEPLITGCTIAENDADLGGGIYIDSTAQPSIENCVIADNDSCGIAYAGLDSNIVSCSDIYSNAGGDICGSIDFTQLNDNLSLNPKFCDPSSHDYAIDSMSLCNADYNTCEEHIGSEEAGCYYPCGDANGDTNINVSDAVYIQNYVFGLGPAPDPLYTADVNCDGNVNVSDAVYILNFVFVQGNPPPCDPDDDGEPDC